MNLLLINLPLGYECYIRGNLITGFQSYINQKTGDLRDFTLCINNINPDSETDSTQVYLPVLEINFFTLTNIQNQSNNPCLRPDLVFLL